MEVTHIHEKAKNIKPHCLNLPDEIVLFGILTKLPVKSLYRFKCVSKLWNITISGDMYFLSSQLNWARHMSNASIIGMYQLLRSLESPTKSVWPVIFASKDCPKIFDFETKDRNFLVGHCNGLFCFRSNDSFEICNPCTRELLYNNFPWSLLHNDLYKSYGFGFDPLRNEYKLVRIVHANRNAYGCIVYTLGGRGDNSWRNITATSNLSIHLNHCTLPHRNETGISVDSGRGLHVNGKLYWFFRNACMALVLDLHNENFESFQGPKPKDSSEAKFMKSIDKPCFLVEWRGCVCVAFVSNPEPCLYKHEGGDNWKFITVDFKGQSHGSTSRIGEEGSLGFVYQKIDRTNRCQVFGPVGGNGGSVTGVTERMPFPPDASLDKTFFMWHIENAASLRTLVPHGAMCFTWYVDKYASVCTSLPQGAIVYRRKKTQVMVKSVSLL